MGLPDSLPLANSPVPAPDVIAAPATQHKNKSTQALHSLTLFFLYLWAASANTTSNTYVEGNLYSAQVPVGGGSTRVAEPFERLPGTQAASEKFCCLGATETWRLPCAAAQHMLPGFLSQHPAPEVSIPSDRPLWGQEYFHQDKPVISPFLAPSLPACSRTLDLCG